MIAEKGLTRITNFPGVVFIEEVFCSVFVKGFVIDFEVRDFLNLLDFESNELDLLLPDLLVLDWSVMHLDLCLPVVRLVSDLSTVH